MVDGKNNSHGVVIIAVSIGKSCNFRTRIPREKRKSTSETKAGKAIPIKQYLHYGIKPLASIKFRSIKDLSISSDIEKLTSSGKWGIFSRNSNLIGPVLCRDI